MRSETPEETHAGTEAGTHAESHTDPVPLDPSVGGVGGGELDEGGAAAIAAELDALHDRFLRLAAEYDNYRKRTERERSESRDRAQAQIVEKLLDPLDDLQRVLGAVTETTSRESLLEVVAMIERKIHRALEGAGLEALDASGHRFDPELHEALITLPTDDRDEDDTVGEVFQSGYRFRGVLIRPARVQVRKFGG